MKTLAAVLATVAVSVPAAVAGTAGRGYDLRRGDTAVILGGETACSVVRLRGGDAFRCKVGGDYRAKFGVTINSREVTVTQYTGFSRYKVISRYQQRPID